MYIWRRNFWMETYALVIFIWWYPFEDKFLSDRCLSLYCLRKMIHSFLFFKIAFCTSEWKTSQKLWQCNRGNVCEKKRINTFILNFKAPLQPWFRFYRHGWYEKWYSMECVFFLETSIVLRISFTRPLSTGKFFGSRVLEFQSITVSRPKLKVVVKAMTMLRSSSSIKFCWTRVL